MIQQNYYDIHSLVTVSVRGDTRLLNEVDLHLESFRCEKRPDRCDIIIDRYEEMPGVSRTTVVDDYEYGSGAYHRAASRICLNMLSHPQTYYMDRLSLPINLLIQLALLRRGHTFLHGAGLSIAGRNVFFPAYPGTGKTTLVAGFVRAGAQMFGDDLCIIGRGQMMSYPQALSVYPHHLPVLNYSDRVAERAFRNTRLLDRIAAPLTAGTSRPARLARVLVGALRTPSVNVAPSQVFGAAAIGSSVTLDEILILERSGEISTLVLEETDAAAAAYQASAILWHEWHASFHDLLLYDALAESGRGTFGRFLQVRDLAQEAFQSVRCARVRIPASWDNATLIGAFPSFWKSIAR